MKTQILTVLLLTGLSASAAPLVPAFSEILQSPELQYAVGGKAESVMVRAAQSYSSGTRYIVSAEYPDFSCAFDVTSDRGLVSVRSLGCRDIALVMPDPTATPTFSKDIQPIFKARCTFCHSPRKHLSEDFTDYKTVVTMKDIIVQHVLVKRDMPMGMRLDPASLALIDAWVKAGLPQ